MRRKKKTSQLKIPKKITKRDGAIVNFELSRITYAVFKAFEATGQPDNKLAEEVARLVAEKLAKKYRKTSQKPLRRLKKCRILLKKP